MRAVSCFAREIANRLVCDLRAAGVSEHRARRGDLEVRQIKEAVKGARHRDPSELLRLRRLGRIDGRQLAAGERLDRDWYHSGFRALLWPPGPADRIGRPVRSRPEPDRRGPTESKRAERRSNTEG